MVRFVLNCKSCCMQHITVRDKRVQTKSRKPKTSSGTDNTRNKNQKGRKGVKAIFIDWSLYSHTYLCI